MPTTQIVSFLITLHPHLPPLLKKGKKPEITDTYTNTERKTHLSNVILQNPLWNLTQQRIEIFSWLKFKEKYSFPIYNIKTERD